MSDYTPSLEEAREQYWAASGDPRRDSGAWGEFDRMIEAVRAETLREAAEKLTPQAHIGWPHNVEVMEAAERFEAILHKKADRIEKEAGL